MKKEEKENYYEPKIVSNFWNNNYIEYESNSNKNRNLSLAECLNKLKPFLRNIINNLQNSDAWKIQLTIAINFISSKGAKEERVIHSSSSNIKLTPYSDANDVIDQLVESFRSRYQKNLKKR